LPQRQFKRSAAQAYQLADGEWCSHVRDPFERGVAGKAYVTGSQFIVSEAG
jgi:hypothetical protein